MPLSGVSTAPAGTSQLTWDIHNFSFPFIWLKELDAATKAFGSVSQGWSLAVGLLGTTWSVVVGWGACLLNLLHLTACHYLSLVVFKDSVQAFVHAVCLNLGFCQKVLILSMCRSGEG